MTDHDPLCPFVTTEDRAGATCQCALIVKVRADERERQVAASVAVNNHVRRISRADLRAKVEALPRTVVELRFAPMSAPERVHAVVLRQVLALLDGGSDDQR